MSHNDQVIWKKIVDFLENFSGEDIDKCAMIYEQIKKAEDESDMFQMFLEYDPKNSSNEKEIEMRFTATQIQKLVKSCKELVSGMVDKLISQDLDEKDFYNKLWESVKQNELLNDNDERICALYLIWKEPRIPYFKLERGLKMANEEFTKSTERLSMEINKAMYILNSNFEQRTERASLLIDLLDNIDCKEDKSVVMVQILSALEKRVLKKIFGDVE